jgi:PiT family inorganic phosphate transporter
VRWAKAKEIVSTWVITIPGAAMVSIAAFYIVHFTLGTI